MRAGLAFGIREGDRSGAEHIGSRVEELGYEELWANDSGGYTGVATLDDSSRETRNIALAIGVIPLHRFGVSEIVDQLQRSALPMERLTLGIGAGINRGLADVRTAVAELREQRPDVKIAIAAVGPRMCQLGGQIADVVLLSWATPNRIRWARERIAGGAEEAARPVPRVAAYVRVALGAGGEERIRHEIGRYQTAPHYARSFSEQEDDLIGIALERPNADVLAQRLEPYRAALDTCVVRGLPATDDVDAWLEIAELAAPQRPRDLASSR